MIFVLIAASVMACAQNDATAQSSVNDTPNIEEVKEEIEKRADPTIEQQMKAIQATVAEFHGEEAVQRIMDKKIALQEVKAAEITEILRRQEEDERIAKAEAVARVEEKIRAEEAGK